MTVDHFAGRESVHLALVRELLGPAQIGRPLIVAPGPAFASASEAYGPWVDQETGEEVLDRDPPTKRYGVGVLYPRGTPQGEDGQSDNTIATEHEAVPEPNEPQPAPEAIRVDKDDLERIGQRETRRTADGDADLDLSAVNALRQSGIAVSLLVELPAGATVAVEVTGGRYELIPVTVEGSPRRWWRRVPVSMQATFDTDRLAEGLRHVVRPTTVLSEGLGPLELTVVAFSRPRGDRVRLVTVSVTNTTKPAPGLDSDASCLFQSRMAVRATVGDSGLIQPYPEREATDDDEEQQSFDLLYRDLRTYAIGHGSAADWAAPSASNSTRAVYADPLPSFETPSVTPDIRDDTPRGRVEISMAKLAGLVAGDDGFHDAERMLDLYGEWIRTRDPASVSERHRAAAARHLVACAGMLERMRRGLEWVKSDPVAHRAFRLANNAVLLQQLRARPARREVRLDAAGHFQFAEPFVERTWEDDPEKGYWRPFQLGFLLATVKSIALGGDVDRERVDLIFFPTGGGKTEAYLGQSAFAIFYRRLLDPADQGVQVLMRYTLRLLTTQQFLRAAGVICAMERLRSANSDLGGPFSIGIWLGSSNTPNSREDAKRKLAALQRGNGENPFLLLRCPWCAAQMGPTRRGAGPRRSRGGDQTVVPGYRRSGDTVVLHCPDATCAFASGLPVYVIDEDIYEKRPSIVIGTVDKFAQLAWSSSPRALFGISEDGARTSSPPGLVIQDELHLIAGPLGSMVGLYETLVEELCTDRRGPVPAKPKIVASTATIRRYAAQISSLYARSAVALFPPHGLDAGDSFFARYATRPDGALQPGRRYVGIHAPGLGSVQTAQVRTFSALLQGVEDLATPEERDPWSTLVAFFNSLRELGTSLTLLQSDIPDYLVTLRNRYDIAWSRLRQLDNVMELTGRLRDDEIPSAIDELQLAETSDRAVDVCLASSILEVGIDIERLALMVLLGQPKSTSQYIQVTGRIGRRWWERPGLVPIIYSASKPRDRSHYERFRSYHERLYANVEPTSVTPFAPPVVSRALHAVLVAYVRQFARTDVQPWPMPELAREAGDLMRRRVAVVDPEEAAAVDRAVEQRLWEWGTRNRTKWQKWSWPAEEDEAVPVIRQAGEWAPDVPRLLSWPTPNSLRNVDAECRASVTPLYLLEASQDAD